MQNCSSFEEISLCERNYMLQRSNSAERRLSIERIYGRFARWAKNDGLAATVLEGEWCLGPESNQRHADFQSAALPTELPRPKPWKGPAFAGAGSIKEGPE
jgi:hypothetical protein